MMTSTIAHGTRRPTEPMYQDLRPGDVVAGRYVLGVEVGSGGMGRVFCASDRELDDVVALKVLRTGLAEDKRAHELFRRELKTARRVTSPFVARAFEYGVSGSLRYITMEFIEGESLASMLERKGRLALDEVFPIARDVVEGLRAVHAAQVVHRDIKPSNVLLRRDGRAVVTDFGVARADREGLRSSSTIGTPAYMAPEQIHGAPATVRSDIFAFGVMLYEMLSGTLPWGNLEPMQQLAARLARPAKPLDDRLAVPVGLRALVMACLEPDPMHRPPTMDEVLLVLCAETAMGTSRVVIPPHLTPLAAPQIARLVVMPFADPVRSDASLLALGLDEDLMSALSSFNTLRVLSRGAVAAQMGIERDPVEVGMALGASYVVEGSVRSIGDLFRVNVRLVGVPDGRTLWSRICDVTEKALLKLHETIASELAVALKIGRVTVPRTDVSDPRALRLYIEARRLCHFFDRDKVVRSIELFAEAHAIAPSDALIMAAYALAIVREWWFAEAPTQASVELARSLAERAILAAPHQAEAHVAMGAVHFHGGNPVAAARSLREAIARAPSLVDAQEMLGCLLLEAGHREEGRRHQEAALALEPSLLYPRWNALRIALLDGDLASEARLMQEMSERQPKRSFRWFVEVQSAIWRNDTATMRRIQSQIEAVGVLDDLHTAFAARACAIRLDGEDPAALIAILDEVCESSRNVGHRAAFFLLLKAEICAHAGRIDDAMETILDAVEMGCTDVVWLKQCPQLEPMRRMPAFQAIVTRLEDRAEQVRDALFGD